MIGIYVSSSCFIVIILAILFTRIMGYIEKSQSKKYALIFVGMVGAYILLDALFMRCFLMDNGNVNGFRVVVFLFYLVYVLVPYQWHRFMQSYMGMNSRMAVRILEAVPVLFLLVLVISSVFTGSVWQISEEHVYTRGVLFGLFALVNLFYYVFAVVQTFCILLTRKKENFQYILKSAVFSAIPLIGILVNTYVIPLYGAYPFQPYCLAIGSLLVYLFMVEHQKNQVEMEHRERLTCALEQEKEASRKAREAGAVKDTFLANMSHDIRTPMNAILGFSDMIARHPDDGEVVRNAVEKIQASGNILLSIINDVLDLSKLDSGRIQAENTATDLNWMAQNMETMLDYSMKKGGIDFEIVNAMEHPIVWCDSTKLQQILVNILNNAVKFTPPGGQIFLKYEERPLPEEGLSEYQISVKDTGIGMDEEFQKHAFEAFERARTSTESKMEGTGLGLAIVKRLVDLMGGQITIQSKINQGTEISIVLSLKHATEAETQPVRENMDDVYSATELQGIRVLLVEDNALNAEIACEVLQEAGMIVDWADNGMTGLDKLKVADAGYYQIILMDIQMPELNGYDATRKIRQLKDQKKAQIPILAMTANAFEEDRKKALEAGMNGFITKPIDIDNMLRVIRTNIMMPCG